MDNYFGKNLKYIRKEKKFTLAEMSDYIGFSSSQINNWELNISFPKFLDLIEIAKKLSLKESDLIHINLENVPNWDKTKSSKYVPMNVPNDVPNHPKKWTDKEHYKEETSNAETVVSEAESTYSEHANNVFDLNSKAAAGTVVQILDDGDKIRQKPNLWLPGLGPGIHIRIGIDGDSMHNTIKSGDKVVCTLVTDLPNIRPGYVYAILDKTDGFVCKRLYWEGKQLEFVSDNEIYKPYKRSLNDLLAIFKVREVHSTDLRPYFLDVRREMREIRSEMAAIRRLITK